MFSLELLEMPPFPARCQGDRAATNHGHNGRGRPVQGRSTLHRIQRSCARAERLKVDLNSRHSALAAQKYLNSFLNRLIS